MSSRVLLVGLDPKTVPGVDAALVEQAIAIGQARFEAEHIETETCLVRPDAGGTEQIAARLQTGTYGCIVIGGGIRKPENMMLLFETVVNLCRTYAPTTPIAFNTNPIDSADAAKRWLG